jgi:hypothetical protein
MTAAAALWLSFFAIFLIMVASWQPSVSGGCRWTGWQELWPMLIFAAGAPDAIGRLNLVAVDQENRADMMQRKPVM